MAHQIDYKLLGDDMQAVVISLDPGEIVQAEAGSMMFMEAGIEMNTEMQGGLLGGIKRKLGGESLFVTTYKNNGTGKRHVSFAAPYPGKIAESHHAAGLRPGKRGPQSLHRRGITVNREHASVRTGALKQRRGVPAATRRSIHIGAALPHLQKVDDLAQQDRLMHPYAPAGKRKLEIRIWKLETRPNDRNSNLRKD